MTKRPSDTMDGDARTAVGSEKHKPYPSYKDSGVEGLQYLPRHWTVKKVTQLFSIGSGTTPPTDNSEYYGGGIPWITTSELRESVVTSTEKTITKKALETFPALNVYPEGSVAVAMYGATIGRLGVLGTSAAVNQACCVFSVPRRIDAWFWFYWLQSRRPYLISLGYGGGQPNLSQELLKSIRVPTPPLNEQRAIAAFLDRETARLDALVAKKERLIELLQEKRTALTTQAVTKGLDPAVQMRDSGFEWLGEIPEHWELKRTKYSARLESGHTPSRQNAEYWQDCQFPWFTLADVWQIREGGEDYVTDTQERVSELGLAHSSARLLPKGTVILSRTASVGFSAIMGVDMATSQDYVNWVCHGDLQPEYLLYVLRSMDQEFQRLTMGSTHRTIYMPDVGQFSAPLPPIEEQREIVEFVRLETSKIDTLLSKVRNAIDRLMELRTALISAAVTGKIDVRDKADLTPRAVP